MGWDFTENRNQQNLNELIRIKEKSKIIGNL